MVFATSQFKTVELALHVPGHTKNVRDCAFGLVKRKMRKSDMQTPRDMMDVIKTSSKSFTGISGKQAQWIDWNLFSSSIYKYPSTLKMNSFLLF